ncbi:MAG TPA: choice-of-anchor J domain-containing protein [Chryseolinea sp.]|nr:choice-of-anchor J domain-containing protein [Chryseolinea sp.]
MKSFYLKNIFFCVLATAIFSGCVDDDDTAIPSSESVIFSERFEGATHNAVLDFEFWTNYSEAGTVLWKTREFDDNYYAEFTSYQSNEASNIAWMITPAIPLEENNNSFLKFAVAQSFVSSASNSLQVLISTDYDGTNVETATWTEVDANIPDADAEYYKFYDSGAISLANFSGDVYIAFKYTGSGTNTSLDGTYQIDEITVYN